MNLLKDIEFEDKIREKFENNEIKISLTHRTVYGNTFMGTNLDKKVELFNVLFNLASFKILPKGEQRYKAYAGECLECGEQIVFIYDNDKCEIRDSIHR